MLRRTRSTRINRFARMFLEIPLEMDLDTDLGIALDTANGEGIFQDIGADRESYQHLVSFPNLRAQGKSQLNGGFNRWSLISQSREFQRGST